MVKNNIPFCKTIIGRPVWFSLYTGELIGIVLYNDGFVDRAYIGLGRGKDELVDIKNIMSMGSPFPVESAKLMIWGKK